MLQDYSAKAAFLSHPIKDYGVRGMPVKEGGSTPLCLTSFWLMFADSL